MSKKKIINIEPSNRLKNLHEIVGGNVVIIVNNPDCCTACGLNGLDPRFHVSGEEIGTLP